MADSGLHVDSHGFILSEKDYAEYQKQTQAYAPILDRRKSRWLKKYADNLANLKPTDNTVLRFVRKGIPHEFRTEAWLSGSHARSKMSAAANKGKYQRLLRDWGDATTSLTEQIDKDLHRTFPEHVEFRQGAPQQEFRLKQLRRVLVVHALYNPGVGYCQGMNYLAAMLLLVTNDEEKAFWLLCVTTDTLMPDYYTQSMESVNTDIAVLERLAEQQLPQLVAHLRSNKIPLHMVASAWFICLFIGYSPTETVLRIMDVFFFEGTLALFQVTLGMLSFRQKEIMESQDFESIYMTLKGLPEKFWDCHQLLLHSYESIKSITPKSIQDHRIEEHRKRGGGR